MSAVDRCDKVGKNHQRFSAAADYSSSELLQSNNNYNIELTTTTKSKLKVVVGKCFRFFDSSLLGKFDVEQIHE